MVALISLKGFPYPAEFRERVRQFNNSLVTDNAKFIADLMHAIPGMKITRFNVETCPEDKTAAYEALIAERDLMLENAQRRAA